MLLSIQKMVSLVCRGCPPTEDMVVCPSRLAPFCLSLLIFSTLHDCMSQQYLRLLCRERKIHPCNLETRSTTEHISREGDCRKSDIIFCHLSLACMSREGNQLQLNLCQQPQCISTSPRCSAVTSSGTLIIVAAICQDPPDRHHADKPTLTISTIQHLFL